MSSALDELKLLLDRHALNTIDLQPTPTSGKLAPWSSKFGGYADWPTNREYPVNVNGKKLPLLIQINLSDVPAPHSIGLPSTGVLQFFVGTNYWDESQKSTHVVFHESVPPAQECQIVTDVMGKEDCRQVQVARTRDIEGLPPESIADMMTRMSRSELPIKNEHPDGSPGECGIRFDGPRPSPLTLCDYRLQALAESVRPQELSDELRDEINQNWTYAGRGTRLGGHCFFFNEDPRSSLDGEPEMLLQVEECRCGPFELRFGDCGVAHFFLSSSDLKERNFGNTTFSEDE